MIRPLSDLGTPTVTVHPGYRLPGRLSELTTFALAESTGSPARHPGWLSVLRQGLGHAVFALEATAAGKTCGYLPLAYVRSLLFGRYLVSLPYLNSNGVVAPSAEVQSLLISRAVQLADELGVRHLELRHEKPTDHPSLTASLTSKVHMRLRLPASTGELWKGFDSKVRNQIRKGGRFHHTVTWGGEELLEDFYSVLSHNMRDLGTPVYGRRLFRSVLYTFPNDAEFCVLRSGELPIAAALVVHGRGITEVPTASSLRAFNPTCANMLMYHHLLTRAVERGQGTFDFGRSTADSSTYRFKKQWGALPFPATWQYYLRQGVVGDLRPEHPRYQRVIRLWQRLPVRVTQYLGPTIVRGIP